jgi:hypothetical protein
LLLAAYCEGDTRAQLVWQASCSLEQLLRQEALAVALPEVEVDGPDNGLPALPGTTHDVWQLAACVLHVIMQLVVVEVCARCSKVPPFAVLAIAKPESAKARLTPRTAMSSLSPRRRSYRSRGRREMRCNRQGGRRAISDER